MTRDQLFQLLSELFSLEELQHICFVLEIDHEQFSKSKSSFIRELIEYCERHDLISKLLAICQSERSEKFPTILEYKQPKISLYGGGLGTSMISAAIILATAFVIAAIIFLIGMRLPVTIPISATQTADANLLPRADSPDAVAAGTPVATLVKPSDNESAVDSSESFDRRVGISVGGLVVIILACFITGIVMGVSLARPTYT